MQDMILEWLVGGFFGYLVFFLPILLYSESSPVFFFLKEIIPIYPELFLGFSIIFLLLHGTLTSSSAEKRFPLIQESVSSLAVLALFFTFFLESNLSITVLCSFFNNTFFHDYLTVFTKLFLLIISIVSILVVQLYLKDQKINYFEYTILVLFSIFGLLLLCSSNDFITAYLAIEIQSLSFYLLASYKKNSIFATESGLKYFILGSFSSGLFLFGSSLIYGITGTTNFEDFNDLFFYLDSCNILSNHPESFLLKLSFYFIFISLFFKLALAPFHLWSPDVYESSLTSSTVFFTVLPKLSLLVFLIRIFRITYPCLLETTNNFIMIVALLSVIVGSFVGLEIRKVKSLLAYSSIGHMGYIMLACSVFTQEGYSTTFLYITVYMITSISVWSVFLLLKIRRLGLKKTNKDLSDFSGLNKSNPTLSIVFSVIILSLAGFPPFLGFFVKLQVFFSLIQQTEYIASIVSIFCSVFSTFYYIRLLKIIFFEKSVSGHLYHTFGYFITFVVTFSFILLIYFFINPNILFLLCQKIIL